MSVIDPTHKSSHLPKLLYRRDILAGAALAFAQYPLSNRAIAQIDSRKVFPQPVDRKPELLLVGPGKQYPSLTLAGCRLQEKWGQAGSVTSDRGPPADKVPPAHVVISPAPPGYYVNDSGSHSRRWPSMVGWPPFEGNLFGPVVIEGEPGKPAPDLVTDGFADGVLYYQAGLFITLGYDAIFRRLHFSGFRRRDGIGNYAAIRLNPQNGRTASVLLEDVEIDHCDDGIMGGDPGLDLHLRRCYFHDNGNETGRCHNVYVADAQNLVVESILSTRCTIGHLLKSRASNTIIRNSRLLGQDGTESACLDIPDAGVLDIDGLVCAKSPGTDANWIIHYAGENQDAAGVPFHLPSSITVRNLTMVAPRSMIRHPFWGGMLGFSNQSGRGDTISGKGSYFVKPEASNVQVYGLTKQQAGLSDVTILPSPPDLDLRSPIELG